MFKHNDSKIFETIQSKPNVRVIPEIQSEYWLNDTDFARQALTTSEFVDDEWMPLTVYRGPHSDRIATALLEHPKLKSFASGVDERAIFSYSSRPFGKDNIPLHAPDSPTSCVCAFYDDERDSYEVACLEIIEIGEPQASPTYEITVLALMDMVGASSGLTTSVGFLSLEDPIVLNVRPMYGVVMADLNSLAWAGRFASGELTARLLNLTEIMTDPYTFSTQNIGNANG